MGNREEFITSNPTPGVGRGRFFSASDSFASSTDSAFGLVGRAMALKSAFCKILGRAYALKFARWATDGNERSTCIVTTPQFLQAQFSNRLRVSEGGISTRVWPSALDTGASSRLARCVETS